MQNFQILVMKSVKDYALLDSGEGEKLERYGKYTVTRPDPQALWQKFLPQKRWDGADAFFRNAAVLSEPGHGSVASHTKRVPRSLSGWKTRQTLPENWDIVLSGLTFSIHLSSFKHTGIFPEQVANWEWMRALIRVARRPISVLNLFGYTGGSTLACAAEGANVCHVDASKVALTWACRNAEISKLSDKPIRWMLDDSIAFLRREERRGRKYDAIIMDPPIFGHGPKGELWKIEEDLGELLRLSRQVLSPQPLFFLMNGYAAGYSALAYENNLRGVLKDFHGEFERGEVAIEESFGKRLLPCGIFARWSSDTAGNISRTTKKPR